MKTSNILLLLALLIANLAFSQKDLTNTYACSTGKIHFFAATPLEDVEATSNTGVCVLNTETKKVSAKIQMNSLVFPKPLMREHFNENYMESDKFPLGSLEAVITNNIDFKKDGVYGVTLKGTFEVHGVKKDREIKGKLTIKNGQPASATAEFDVRVADHNIKIPTAVVMKIAEVVKVDVSFVFEKYQKN